MSSHQYSMGHHRLCELCQALEDPSAQVSGWHAWEAFLKLAWGAMGADLASSDLAWSWNAGAGKGSGDSHVTARENASFLISTCVLSILKSSAAYPLNPATPSRQSIPAELAPNN
mmetsp:Transcript_36864/g.68688  ORF Transcript_36864/g.68688 Transcript_36864/m.68688 type:complete len:115 (+) Transcript_36864:336-680(+)